MSTGIRALAPKRIHQVRHTSVRQAVRLPLLTRLHCTAYLVLVSNLDILDSQHRYYLLTLESS